MSDEKKVDKSSLTTKECRAIEVLLEDWKSG
jgi:hypothetical protein